jgi:hypothetical protein
MRPRQSPNLLVKRLTKRGRSGRSQCGWRRDGPPVRTSAQCLFASPAAEGILAESRQEIEGKKAKEGERIASGLRTMNNDKGAVETLRFNRRTGRHP